MIVPRRYLAPLLLTGILLLAFALRFYRIGLQSIWYDEIFALSVSRLPFTQMNQALIQDVVHPPLHYYLLHEWFQVFGFGPMQARMLSLVFGVLGVVMLYVLARYMFDRATALVSALLLALSQLTIMYSQEARPYAQCVLLVLCTVYFFLRALRERKLALWAGFLISAALLLYTHYYGIFALMALGLFALIYRKAYPIPRAWWLGGAFSLVVAYTPWLAGGTVKEALYGHKFHLAKSSTPPLSGPAQTVAAEKWYTPITILNTFNNGRPNGVLEASPWWTFLIGGILFVVPAAASLRCLQERTQPPHCQMESENVAYLVLLSGLPILGGLAIAHFIGSYAIRYIAFAAAPYYVLVARGISTARRPLLRASVILCIVAYSTYAVKANYSVPYKEDYKNALAFVARDYRPGDCAAVAQFWEERQTRWAWSIYEAGRPGPEIRPLNAVASAPGGCERVWLLSVFYRGNPVAVRAAETARQKLQQAYIPGERKRFFWITVDLFTRDRKEVSN